MPKPIAGPWIAAFVEVRERCSVRSGDACAVLAESRSRPVLPQLAALSLQQIGARHFRATVPCTVDLDGAAVVRDGVLQ